MRILFLTLVLLASLSSHAQETKRVSVRKSKRIFQLVGDDTLEYKGYIKSKGVTQRYISTPKNKYIITKKRGPQGSYQEIRDENGTLVGTVYLSGKFKFDVFIPSGEHYDWKKTDKATWYYQFQGKTILTGKYRKAGKERGLFQAVNAAPVNEILILSSYERGLDVIEGKGHTPIYILVAIMTYVITRTSL